MAWLFCIIWIYIFHAHRRCHVQYSCSSGLRFWIEKTIWVSRMVKLDMCVADGPVIISSEPWDATRAALCGGTSRRCVARAPRMLRLHYFSDHPALGAASEEEESVYSIELIKEFEAVGRAWKAFLADWLLKGAAFVYQKTRHWHTSRLGGMAVWCYYSYRFSWQRI